jgi:hypothetical protein
MRKDVEESTGTVSISCVAPRSTLGMSLVPIQGAQARQTHQQVVIVTSGEKGWASPRHHDVVWQGNDYHDTVRLDLIGSA